MRKRSLASFARGALVSEIATEEARGQLLKLTRWWIPIPPAPITAQRSLSAITYLHALVVGHGRESHMTSVFYKKLDIPGSSFSGAKNENILWQNADFPWF